MKPKAGSFALAIAAFGVAGAAWGAETASRPVTLEIGMRYWHSAGRTGNISFDDYDFGDGRTERLRKAKLDYRGLAGDAAEAFFRVEDEDGGWFVKGNLGGGALGGGHMTDEGYTPFLSVYSNTRSHMHGGNLAYFTLDVGHELWQNDRARLGAFLGYNFYYETAPAFGRVQTASYPAFLPGEVESYVPEFTQDNNWHLGRAGLSGRIRLIDRLDLDLDAAFVYGHLDGKDHHIQSDYNPLPIRGDGPGTQLEAVLSYPIADAVSLGVGGRYWAFWSDGSLHWNAAYGYPGSEDKSAGAWSRRYGGFVQLAVKFGYLPAPSENLDLDEEISEADGGQKTAANPVVWELGMRYGRSSGNFGYNLYDDENPAQRNSRLTYHGLGADSGELFFRVEHRDGGWFAKGAFGGGIIGGGRLADEDFVTPDFPVYSRTVSGQRGGKLAYLTLDVGHELWQDGRARLGAFAGYGFSHEIATVFGCTQTAAADPCRPGDVSTELPALAQEDDWHAVRVGLSGRVRLIDRLSLNVDAAFVYAFLRGEDHHILRPDINPLPLHGDGPGGQFEAVLDYPLSETVSLGVGGRYWTSFSGGYSLWGRTVGYRGDGNNKTTVWSRRYGAFVQLSVRLNGLEATPDKS